LGQYEEAMKDFNYAIELNPKNGFPYYKKAYLYTLQGNIATACFLLHQAFKLDFRRLCKLVKTDPDFNSIREDERFKKLIAEYCSGC
jgi:tetratricopeptide (TPR) repeat protein